MIQRFKSWFQGSSEVSAEGGTRTEKLRRFQTTFSLVYWLVTLLVLAYAFSLARIGDRPLLIGLALIAATINFLFLHFRPLRFSFSHGALTMVVVTSVFALLLVYWTGPLDSPFFAAILLLVLTASLVLSRVAAVAVVSAISLAFLGMVAVTSQLGTPSSLLIAGVQLATLWLMAYVGGFLSQELTLRDGELTQWELEQRVRDASQGARDVFAGTINDLKNALDEVLERVTFALRIPAAGIFLLDEEKRGLILTSYTGLPSDLAELVAVQRLAGPGAGLGVEQPCNESPSFWTISSPTLSSRSSARQSSFPGGARQPVYRWYPEEKSSGSCSSTRTRWGSSRSHV